MSTDTATSVPPRPRPVIESINRPFWDAAAEGRLVVQRCESCGHHQFPATESCPKCGVRGMNWVTVSGLGRVHTYTVIHYVYHPAFADAVPYNVAIIELDEGPLMLSNVVGIDNSEIEIDQRVAVQYQDIGDSMLIPVFTPVDEGTTAAPAGDLR